MDVKFPPVFNSFTSLLPAHLPRAAYPLASPLRSAADYRRFRAFCLLWLVLLTVGCGLHGPPDPKTALPPDPLARDLDRFLGTTWYGIYLQDGKVGYGTVAVIKKATLLGPVYRIEIKNRLAFKSMGCEIRRQWRARFDFDGRPPYGLRRYRREGVNNGDAHTVEIVRESDRFHWTLTQPEGTQTRSCESLPYTLADALAERLWVLKRPEVGDVIRHTELAAESFAAPAVESRIARIGREDGGVRYTVDTRRREAPSIRMVYGGDGGLVRFGFADSLEYRREPKKAARRDVGGFDAFIHNMVMLDMPIGAGETIRRLELGLSSPAAELLATAPGQSVHRDAAAGRFILTIDPANGPRIAASYGEISRNLVLSPEARAAEEHVRRLSEEAVAGIETPREKVAALVRFVNTYLQYTLLPEGAPLGTIIAAKAGDCTEYAELLTALARYQRIPCRTVSGLLYMGDAARAFGGHAWNEVVLDGVWLPVDATTGDVTVGADRIRFPTESHAEMEITRELPSMRLKLLKIERAN